MSKEGGQGWGDDNAVDAVASIKLVSERSRLRGSLRAAAALAFSLENRTACCDLRSLGTYSSFTMEEDVPSSMQSSNSSPSQLVLNWYPSVVSVAAYVFQRVLFALED
jgi:hypothetical protein